jgi:hypothetical protein
MKSLNDHCYEKRSDISEQHEALVWTHIGHHVGHVLGYMEEQKFDLGRC